MKPHKNFRYWALLLLTAGLSACTINGLDEQIEEPPVVPEQPQTGLVGQWVDCPMPGARYASLHHEVISPDGAYCHAVTTEGNYRPDGFDVVYTGRWSDYDPLSQAAADSGQFTLALDDLSRAQQYHFEGDTLYVEGLPFGSRRLIRASKSPFAWEPVMSLSLVPRQATTASSHIIVRPGEPYDVVVRPLVAGNACRIVRSFLHLYQPDPRSGQTRHDSLDVTPLYRADGGFSVPLQAPMLTSVTPGSASQPQTISVALEVHYQFSAQPYLPAGLPIDTARVYAHRYDEPFTALIMDYDKAEDMQPQILSCRFLNVEPMLPGSIYSMADAEITLSGNVDTLEGKVLVDDVMLYGFNANCTGRNTLVYHLESLDLDRSIVLRLRARNLFGVCERAFEISPGITLE